MPNVRRNLALTVTPGLFNSSLRTAPLFATPIKKGVAISGAFATNGGTPPYAYTTSGSPPAWLTVDPTTGKMTGTPTAAGPVNFLVTVTDSATPTPATFTTTVSFLVQSPLAPLPSNSVPFDAEQNTPYSYLLKTTPTANPTRWTVSSGFLLPGLSLGGQGPPAITTTTSGAVTSGTSGSTPVWRVPITSSTAYLSTIVNGEFVYVFDGSGNFMRGQVISGIAGPGSVLFIDKSTTSTGANPPTSITTGATVTTEQGGLITGTVPTTGTLNCTIQATDTVTGDVATFQITMRSWAHGSVVFDNLAGSALPPIVLGQPWSATVHVNGGKPPYSQFQDTDGTITSLGLVVNPTTGTVSGTINDSSLATTTSTPPYLLEVLCYDSLGVMQITAQGQVEIINPQQSIQSKVAGISAGPIGAQIENWSADFAVTTDGFTKTISLATPMTGLAYVNAIGSFGPSGVSGTTQGLSLATTGGPLTLSLEAASATNPGGVSTGAQSFAGNKTFTGTISASNLSGTNTGDWTLGNFAVSGAAGTAKGISINFSGTWALSLEAASATNPGGVSTGTQTFAGNKTWNGLSTFTGATFQGASTVTFQGGFVVSGGNVNWNASTAFPGALAATGGYAYTNSNTGLTLYGFGAVNDFTILNHSGTTVANIPAGTVNIQFAGTVNAVGAITGSNLSGTNTGNVTVAAIGSTPNANGMTLTGQQLNLEAANASFPGVVTTAAQNFAGAKVFQALLIGYMLKTPNGGWVDATCASSGNGSYVGWNKSGGQGEFALVNNRPAVPGGWIFYDTTDGVTYTNVASISNAGALSLSASINATTFGNFGTYTKVNANAGIGGAGQGLYCGWNFYGGGTGDFFNHHGGGATGGFAWTDTDGTTPVKLATLDMKGQFTANNHCSNTINKGTVAATATLDFTTGQFQTLTTTSATNLTLTFTAPAGPCLLHVRITAPPSGTTPTITYPATVKGAPPATVTLAKISMLQFFWDGTNYWYMSGALNL